MIYKRIVSIINIALFVIATFMVAILCACKTTVEDERKLIPEINGEVFSVHVLDVGQGDCILINFPNALMLIDAGTESESSAKYIADCIKATGKDKIDYLVITHPDEDHVGNVSYLTEYFLIGKVYLPYIIDRAKFPYFEQAYTSILEKAEEIIISEIGIRMQDEDWFFKFLWPISKSEGGYMSINNEEPTANQINDISAVIYLDYKGLRFLFNGDCGKNVADKIMEFYNLGVYETAVYDGKINLNGIDFLKVSHHGSKEAINKEFYELLSPKNAGISVGAGNVYGHPATETLTTLKEISNCNIYRTDINSTISIYENNGEAIVKTII